MGTASYGEPPNLCPLPTESRSRRSCALLKMTRSAQITLRRRSQHSRITCSLSTSLHSTKSKMNCSYFVYECFVWTDKCDTEKINPQPRKKKKKKKKNPQPRKKKKKKKKKS